MLDELIFGLLVALLPPYGNDRRQADKAADHVANGKAVRVRARLADGPDETGSGGIARIDPGEKAVTWRKDLSSPRRVFRLAERLGALPAGGDVSPSYVWRLQAAPGVDAFMILDAPFGEPMDRALRG